MKVQDGLQDGSDVPGGYEADQAAEAAGLKGAVLGEDAVARGRREKQIRPQRRQD